MGCSPSRANQFGGLHGSLRRGRTLLPASRDNGGESPTISGVSGAAPTDTEADEERLTWTTGDKHSHQDDMRTAKDEERNCVDKLSPQEITYDIPPQTKAKTTATQDSGEKKAKKNKKTTKGAKPGKRKEKKIAAAEAKVDFPELLVKAHQAAYSYLNPSITKYEVLLRLLDHAAETQVSVQPMVAFMLMRYEEIIKGLEEIVEEGERLLKENGEHLAWPSHAKSPAVTSAKGSALTAQSEPPPDLLQQLLQYTIHRMHQVSQSVGGVGDAALEEAVDYFTSVSDMLEEKLKAKRSSEARLMRLLRRIEAATLRKPGPEDCALFSEDSGIGAESESLNGSDRQRRRRESCGSTATNFTLESSTMGCTPTPIPKGPPSCTLTRKTSSSLSLNSIDSFCNYVKEQRDFVCSSVSAEDYEGEDVGDADIGAGERGGREGLTTPPVHESQQPRRLPSKRIENPQNIDMTLKMRDAISGRIKFVSQKTSARAKSSDSPKINRRQWTEEEQAPKRPQTPTPQPPKKKAPVSKARRTHSADSLRTKGEDATRIELERTQKDLTQRLERMSKAEGNIRKTAPKSGKGKTQPSSPSTTARLRPLQKTAQSPSKVRKKADPASTPAKEVTERESVSLRETETQTESADGVDEKATETTVMPAPTPSSPPPQRPAGLYRGRNSVKRLIDTFSQGVEEVKQTPENVKILGPLKGVIKCGIPIIPGLGGPDTILTIGNDKFRADSRCSDRADDVDIDSLPPPPLEVLMDNSFENVQKPDADDGRTTRGGGHSPLLRRASVTQKLRASMQCVSVLPSRGALGGSAAGSVQHDLRSASVASSQDSTEDSDRSFDPGPKHGAKRVLPKEKPCEQLPSKPLFASASAGLKQRDSSSSAVVPSSSSSGSQTVTTASVSRARILPSTPVATSSLGRRLPSPPVFRRQPTPPSSGSPTVTRKLPTPPPVNHVWRHPSPSATRQDGGQTANFKAPSPPASPKLKRWSRENSSEDLPSSPSSSTRLVSNARSVFCPISPSLFEAKPFPPPQPPQAWGSNGNLVPTPPGSSRGRQGSPTHRPKALVRRSLSDRRPSLTSPHRPQGPSVAESCGSEPAIASQE